MQTRIQSTMGMQVPFEVPSTIQEFAEACGVAVEQAEAIVLKYAVDEGMFRTVLPNFRKPFFERLEQESGIARRQVGKTTKTVDGEKVDVPVLEQDGSYFKHVQAEQNKEPADYEEIGVEVASDTPFDLRSKPRAGKPGKEYLTRAAGLAQAVESGRGTWEKIVANLTSLNPGISVETGEDGTPELESVARALKVDADRRSKEQTSDLI